MFIITETILKCSIVAYSAYKSTAVPLVWVDHILFACVTDYEIMMKPILKLITEIMPEGVSMKDTPN